ncbi:hypothetical protein [Paraherbaspirillum soli]|uniref:SPOR domain-containing protein n=1 Tax=Paraherbaspirillum soli TaxID=631222 RepID=A0ABW0ME36_9BURK
MKQKLKIKIGNPLPRLRWHAQGVLERIGRNGVLAAAAALGLVAYQGLALLPEGQALQQEQQTVTADLAKLSRAPAPTAEATQTAAALLGANISARKLIVFELLRQYGLDVSDSTYREDEEVKGRMARWTLNVVASGRYSDLSRALTALQAQPLLRLDAVSLERQKIEDTLLSMKLRLSLLGDGR